MVFSVTVWDDAVDLLAAGDCAGCGRPGRGLCLPCRATINAGVIAQVPRPAVPVPVWSAGVYEAPLDAVIVAAKEHERWDTVGALSARLALAVAALLDEVRPQGSGVIVPIPSSAKSVRQRGLDVVGTTVDRATAWLVKAGAPLTSHHWLTVTGAKDQGGLTQSDRLTNLRGTMRVKGTPTAAWVILADDVVTTGSSLAEGTRALTTAGLTVLGAATVGATVLHH